MLLNLLNNAVKFTPSGRVELALEHRSLSATEEYLCFSVIDTGIGIPATKRDGLFQRFSQVDGSRNRQYGGTGLGLAISKQLVELMGGSISLESEAERGTTVRVEVTLSRSSVTPVRTSDAQMPQDIVVAARPGRILVAEDIEINQEIIRAVLEAAGHSVEVVSDGAQAIKAVREGLRPRPHGRSDARGRWRRSNQTYPDHGSAERRPADHRSDSKRLRRADRKLPRCGHG